MLNLAIILSALFSLLIGNHRYSVYALLVCLLLVALVWFNQQAWWLLGYHLLIMIIGCGVLLWRGVRE